MAPPPLLPLSLKNQRIRGARFAWAPKKEEILSHCKKRKTNEQSTIEKHFQETFLIWLAPYLSHLIKVLGEKRKCFSSQDYLSEGFPLCIKLLVSSEQCFLR